jgi:hypothetical protein
MKTLEFPLMVVEQAWERACGQCECRHAVHGHHIPCGRKLEFGMRGVNESGGWEIHAKNRNESPTLANSEVQCFRCYKQSRMYTG